MGDNRDKRLSTNERKGINNKRSDKGFRLKQGYPLHPPSGSGEVTTKLTPKDLVDDFHRRRNVILVFRNRGRIFFGVLGFRLFSSRCQIVDMARRGERCGRRLIGGFSVPFSLIIAGKSGAYRRR